LKKIKASILGAAGYTGGELLKILLRHPHAEIAHVTSQSSAGRKIEDVHPSLRGLCPLTLEKPDRPNYKKIASDSEIVFLALPVGEASLVAANFVAKGRKVIDLSADFRLDKKTYHKFYLHKHGAPDLLKKAVYGLPELFRENIHEFDIVANPGCYATAAILALAPLVKYRLVETDSIIVDAKSGVSGAGKKLELAYSFSEANENMTPYAVVHHRHTPEMEGVLSKLSNDEVTVTFVPQLAPMTRGILAICYAKAKKDVDIKRTHQRFVEFFKNEPFIRVLESGFMPQTKSVLQTNFCDIGVAFDSRTDLVIIASALDNLVKGASGQAVQNMNLLFGFEETEGLL
jgi:N-acetyl-gamma-glutamyl-phosphate reductase